MKRPYDDMCRNEWVGADLNRKNNCWAMLKARNDL